MDLNDAISVKISALQREQPLHSGRLEFGIGGGLMLVAASLAATSTPLLVVAPWLVVCSLAYFARFALLEKFKAHPDAGPSILPQFILSLAATGIAFGGLAAWVFFQSGATAASPLLLLLVALSALSLLIHGGGVPVVLAVNLSAIGPLLVAFSLRPDPDAYHALIALVGATAAIVMCARQRRHAAWLAAVAAEENEQLRNYLDQRREQVEKLQVEVKAMQLKREESETELRRMSADVGMAQGKSKALSDMLTRVSPIDQVTGLDNRRHFEENIDAEWRRALREAKLVSLLIVEVDDMDTYVDTYGRPSADIMLKRVALALRGLGRRAGDTAARYDETRLALLLPNCDAPNAERLAEAMREKIASANLPHARAKSGKTLTTHIGVATVKPSKNQDCGVLLKRAESALYQANFQGGNTVSAYQPLSQLRLEHWDLAANGLLSEQSMTQKLLIWGYDTRREVLAVGSKTGTEALEGESMLGIMTGELALELEGHTMRIKGGDCVIVPAGIALGMAVVGTRPVLKFTASRLN